MTETPTPSPTATFALQVLATLTSGTPYAVQQSVSWGDLLIFSAIMFVGLVCLMNVLMRIANARTT
jgi:hypothetical protein